MIDMREAAVHFAACIVYQDKGRTEEARTAFLQLAKLLHQDRAKIFALLSKQGTACSETVLFAHEYTAEGRARIEAAIDGSDPDGPVPGTWTDCTDNDALQGWEGWAFVER
jgi:hypothetical protein